MADKLDDNAKLLIRVRDRFETMKKADDRNMRLGMENFEFINRPGAQWEQQQRESRRDRPCYEFNKTRINAKKIINHIRTNRPQGKVRGVEGADKQQAEYREGLIRNIWNQSDGDSIIDYAAEYQVGAGMGAWKVTTGYRDDESFDQDIMVAPIVNPFCLFHDPAARDMVKRDAEDWLLTEKISKSEYERTYPDKKVVDFQEHEFDKDSDSWGDDDFVRIAEYWYKVPHKKEIWMLDDGKVIDSETDEAKLILDQSPDSIVRKREVKAQKIMQVIVSGDAILKPPKEWAGKHFPFIKVYGEHMIIDGTLHWYGIAHFAKDAQRSYNVSRTAITETIARTPLEHYWATTKQAEGNEQQWAEAHKEALPVMLFNHDPQEPGPPDRSAPAQVPVALIQEAQMASQEIDDVTGVYADDRGQESSSQSGRAIYARQEQGQIVTFNYPDNMAKGIQRTWEILIDLIPKIYDTQRTLRVLGQDGEESYFLANTFMTDPDTGVKVKVNDLTVGKYDVVATVGPSFTTKRQEAVEVYQPLMDNPQIFGLVGDIIFKAMDLPYSDEIAERMKLMLPPEIQQTLNEEQDIPPEVQAMMQQANQAMQVVQEQSQLVQQQANEADVAKSEVEKLTAQLETKQARFEAKVAKEIANLTQKASDVSIREAGVQDKEDIKAYQEFIATDVAQFKEVLIQDLAQAIESIQGLAAELASKTENALEEVKTKPRIARIKAVRKDGELFAEPEYEDAS